MPISSQSHHRRYDAPRQSQRRLLFFFLKCVIMAAVISIFLFFLGFAAIVVLHFLFMSSAFHHDRTTTDGRESRKVQALLHDVVYRDVGLSEVSECAICLDSFVEGEYCRNIPACKHLFHSKCVDRWIRKKPTCPVCRSPVEMNPDGSNGSGSSGSDTWKRLWDVNFEGTSY